ncbi:MAG: hypothetical protein HYY93_11150 [Planctomycetes bacterium]|nr:hypothetical protein [Planctomycetota bacterium]
MGYLKETGQLTPEIRTRLEEAIGLGYQKILTFQRPAGGFDWWGSGEPLVWLTAYGIQQLADMSKVHDVDPEVLARARRWLVSMQQADGSWTVVGGTHGETIASLPNPAVPLTSYVVWSLASSGPREPAVVKGLEFLRQHAGEAKDAYSLALLVNALAACDPAGPVTATQAARLAEMATTTDGLPSWSTAQTLAYSTGSTASIETTALAALALGKFPAYGALANDALATVTKGKDGYGGWHSTQATILAIKALIETRRPAPGEGPIVIVARVNGVEARRLSIPESDRDLMQVLPLRDFARDGRNEVELTVEGEGSLSYEVVARHYMPWRDASEGAPPLTAEVRYDRTNVRVTECVSATAIVSYRDPRPSYMGIVELGIPPGFSPMREDFERLMQSGKINRYTLTGRQATLYLGDLRQGVDLTLPYRLLATSPVRAKAPEGRVYEYYSPDRGQVIPPVGFVAQ